MKTEVKSIYRNYLTLEEIGRLVRQEAQKQDLTQMDLAHQLDISQSMISDAMRGKSPRWTCRLYTHLTGRDVEGRYYRIE